MTRVESQVLAQHARYIDLSGMGAVGTTKDHDHEVFGKIAMNGQAHVCAFFEQAICGKDILLDPAVNVESVERKVVYKLWPKFDPNLEVPKLPD